MCPLDINEDGRVCNDNGYAVRLIISCLPAFWQLMQCSRCYHHTKNYVYLIDAVKASTTFPVVILFVLFTEDHPSLTECFQHLLSLDCVITNAHSVYLHLEHVHGLGSVSV